MTALATMSEQLLSSVETETADATSLATNELLKEQFRDEWQQAIDKCVAWGESPSKVDEDDLESPSREAASRAGTLLARLRDNGGAPPTWVVPTGEGGIMLELIRGNQSTSFEIESDGSAEYRLFGNSRLILREEVPCQEES